MEKRKQRDERREDERRQKGGYERNAHGLKKEGVSNPLCPFCNTYLFVDYILWEWECKETEDQRMNMDMRKEQWINGIKGMEKMIDYAKEIGLYNGI
jgi:hypothetical protein